MDNERIREFCLSLPHAAETLNWGHHLVYWAGDREHGRQDVRHDRPGRHGDRRAVVPLRCGAVSRAAGARGNHPLTPPGPGLLGGGRAMGCLRPREIEEELKRAHALIYEKLPKRTKAALDLPLIERAKAIRERKRALAAKAEAPAGRNSSRKSVSKKRR